MRPGKDMANEFVDMAKMARIFGRYGKFTYDNRIQRILLYCSERWPNSFELAVKHLRAMGKTWAQ